MGAQSKTSARRVKTRERKSTALKLRASGATYAAIAEHLGITAQSAYALVKNALDEIPAESVPEFRAIENVRLDRMTAAMWRGATDGDFKAIDRVIRIMERRAKMMGLDAPTLLDDVSDWTNEELLDYAATGKRPTRRTSGARTEEARAIQAVTTARAASAVAESDSTAQP